MKSLRWEGTFFRHHSLAHVNRQICERLMVRGTVRVYPKSYEVDEFTDGWPYLRDAMDLQGDVDLHVRHHWPPNFERPSSGRLALFQPWEFGGMPQEWLHQMGTVDEVWCYTNWIRDNYIASGIPAECCHVIPLGLSGFHRYGDKYPLKTQAKYKFLFVGGLIHRKGIDLLVRAFQWAFRPDDSVCLVIKAQPGAVYDQQGVEDAPNIEVTSDTLTDSEMASLYRACDCLVQPYRGEGFCLPIAEAMSVGIPVICTGKGAAAEFVSDQTAYLIPSATRFHNSVYGLTPPACGFWLEEPDERVLFQLLRYVYEHQDEARDKGRGGRHYADNHLSWIHTLDSIEARL